MTQIDNTCLCGEGYDDGTCCGWKPEAIKSELEIRRVGGDWFTVKIDDNLHVDLATSKFDKRDRIISKRDWLTLEQDKGFIASYSKKGWTLTELKAELLDIAKEIADDRKRLEK